VSAGLEKNPGANEPWPARVGSSEGTLGTLQKGTSWASVQELLARVSTCLVHFKSRRPQNVFNITNRRATSSIYMLGMPSCRQHTTVCVFMLGSGVLQEVTCS